MIVDTSALIAVLRGENGSGILLGKMLAAADVRISAGTLVEARMVAERDRGGGELAKLIALIGSEIVPVDADQAEIAHEGFRRFGKGRHRAALNLGDLFAYALARSADEPLLFIGGDFVHTDVVAA